MAIKSRTIPPNRVEWLAICGLIFGLYWFWLFNVIPMYLKVCQQWEQFIMDRVWARMEARLVRNWLSGEPSVVVEEYRGLVPLLWGLIAMDSQLVIVWPEQEGPRVMERNSGR